jgi:CheY-like chemotaxis protein
VSNATYRILYADDDADDHFILKESFQSNGIHAEMVSAVDGQEALQYLETVHPASLPSLIILDLNMPRMDGRQTLSLLKKHPYFSSIPVVILSTSNNKAEKEYCQQQGAASYFIKPRHYTGYQSLVQSLQYFM